MSKKKSNLKIQNSGFSGQFAPSRWAPAPYPNNWQQNQDSSIVFRDKEFLKVKRELELTDMKQRLVHAKQTLKASKKSPVSMKVKYTKEQRKFNKLQCVENSLLLQQRILQLRLQIKAMKRTMN